MDILNEFGAALKVSSRLLSRRQFWAGFGRASLSPPLLLVLAGIVLLYASVDWAHVLLVGNSVWLGALVCAWLLLPPTLMHAWCPAIARSAAAFLQLDLQEVQAPALWRFMGWWLLVLLVVGVGLAASLLLPRDGIWLQLLPLVLMGGWFHLRAALCLHAKPRTAQAVARATFLRRTLVWMPLAAGLLVLSVRIGMAAKGWLLPTAEYSPSVASRLFDLGLIALQAPVAAAVLTLWGVLALRALDQMPARDRQHSPSRAVPPRATAAAHTATPGAARPPLGAPSWKATLLVLLLLAPALAYLSRLRLYDLYLTRTDPAYAAENPPSHYIGFEQRMEAVLHRAACKGDRNRVSLLDKAGQDIRGPRAMACAIRNNRDQVVEYLLARGASANGSLDGPHDDRPLLHAVRAGHVEMAHMLLRAGAQPNIPPGHRWRQAGEPSLLAVAAQRGDVAMLRALRTAGAESYEEEAHHPAFLFVEASARDAGRDWEAVIASLEKAGLSIRARDTDGASLLHWAASHGEFRLIALLLKGGIDPLQADGKGELPFLRLARWYQGTAAEPGQELELALSLLSAGVADINVPGAGDLANIAAARRRVRLAFAGRIDYSHLGGRDSAQRWPLNDRRHAEQLLADLQPVEFARAPALAAALREQGWDDLAQAVERRR